MKILFLSTWLPHPPINGAKIRIYNQIRELAKSHEIILLSLAQTIPMSDFPESITWLEQFCRKVEVVPAIPLSSKGFQALRSFTSLLPRSIVQTYNQDMADLIKKYVSNHDFDVVIASEVNAPSVMSLLATQIEGIPIILDALEISLAKDDYFSQSSTFGRIRKGLTWFKLKYFTKQVVQKSEVCTVPSSVERQNLLEIVHDPKKIEVVPHSLDLSYYSISDTDPINGMLTFTGSFTYFPNLDAMRFFLKDIFPLIKSHLPNTTLQIIGDTNGYSFDGVMIDDSVRFTGFIRDVRSVIASSWLSVVPLRFGSGTRVKIIESMALGIPVVSTKKGADGLEVEHEKNILLADNPKEFADDVIKLLQNPELRERLAFEGRELVKRNYSMEAVGSKFEAILDRMF